MKLTARQDIDASFEAAFRVLADFDHWERAALRRGVDVLRTDAPPDAVPGRAWRIGFAWRGRPRNLNVHLTEIDAPQRLRFAGASTAAEGTLTIDVVALGARRTRLSVSVEVKPRTLAARLFIQSLRLARGRVNARFENAVAALAANIADRQGRIPGGRP